MPGKGIPEIKWGTFHAEKGIAHVAPEINGTLMRGHTLSERCACSVTVEKSPYILIVIHHVIH